MIQHPDLVDENDGLVQVIPVSLKGWDNIIIKIGQINFKENPENGTAHLQFNYDVIKGELKPEDKEEYEQALGDAIISHLEEQLKQKELVYYGGLDEDRVRDT